MPIESTNSKPIDLLLKDFLSEITRKERRFLLVSSLVGIIISKAGLIPSKVSALGIEFTQVNQQVLLQTLAFIIIYFIIAFSVYAYSDVLIWRAAYNNMMINYYENETRGTFPGTLLIDQSKVQEKAPLLKELSKLRLKQNRLVFLGSITIPILKILFEFCLPVILGIVAVWNLWTVKIL